LLAKEEMGHREAAAFNRTLAALTAMQGGIQEARNLIAGERDKLARLGLALVTAGALLVHAQIEILDQDWQAAEALLRDGLSQLRGLHENLLAAEFAACLARVVVIAGNYKEAQELAAEASRSRTFDIAVPVLLRSTRAKIKGLLGEHEEALRSAEAAVRVADRTDLVNLQGDAYGDLGDAHEVAGELQAASNSWKQALAHYERKGNLVAAAQIRTKLER